MFVNISLLLQHETSLQPRTQQLEQFAENTAPTAAAAAAGQQSSAVFKHAGSQCSLLCMPVDVFDFCY